MVAPARGPSTGAKEVHRSGSRLLTPLSIISLFLTLSETVLGIAVSQTAGGVQVALTVFVMTFPVLVAAAFFLILWDRPYVFYAPSEYGQVDFERYIGALRDTRFEKIATRTSDLAGEIQVVGNPDRFRLLFKAAGGNWWKSTKAMEVGEGCIVQVTNEQLNADGSVSVAEAAVFVPDVEIVDDEEGSGRYLRPRTAA
jgi:hypothetical protein